MSGVVYGMDVFGGLSGYSCAWVSVLLTWAGETDVTHTMQKVCGPHSKAQHRFSSYFPITPWSVTLLGLGVPSSFSAWLVSFPWQASSFWVFSSTKWGESTVLGSSLSLSQGGLGIKGFAVSGG